ncbi:MAG: hypothetical protein J6C66_05235 [Prevotella sp.]|nr:hypothetical protein [Prevotella sp.]
MAIEFKKTKYSGHTPEIWRGECKILPGGFKLTQNFPVGTVIHCGTPVAVDFAAMSATVIKSATVLEGGNTKVVRVAKGHLFVAGDVVVKNGAADATATVSSVDTANTEYDVLNLSAAITGLTTGDVLVVNEQAAPNMVVGAVLEITGKGLPTLDVAYDAVVLYPSLNLPILEDWLNGPCLKSNPNILFIKQ